MTHLRFYFQIYNGEIWKELVKFKQHVMEKGNPYEYFNVDKILEINSWFVLPSYRRKGLYTVQIVHENVRISNKYKLIK